MSRDPNGVDDGGFGWRRLQIVAAYGVVASLLLPMVITLRPEPFLAAMAAPFILGLLLMLPWQRAGAILLGVASLGVLASSAPFLVDALSHPESMADFLPLALFAVSTLLGTVAAVPSIRQGARPDSGSPPARSLALAGGALLGVAAVVSIVAFLGIESDPVRSGDIRVATEDIEFSPTLIEAEAGTVSVYVTNHDATRHTFTIDALRVDLNLPPNNTQRVTFEAAAGTYRFYCRPHSSEMQGTLTVR